ncbi:MAG: ABC transporter ATP-binding protein [Actinobacteria bacterium]|nr:ABC transporter ATP-binding protein [Actinomycetota bacterium]
MVTVLSASFRADPVRAALNLVLTVTAMATQIVSALALKYLTDAVLQRDVGQVTTAAAALGAMGALGVVAGWGQFNLSIALRENVAAYLDARLIALATSVPGIEHHERSDYLDEIELLRTDREALGGAMEATVSNIGMATQIIGTVALLGRVHPLLLLLPLFGFPSIAAGAWAERRRQRAMESVAEDLRVSRHLFELATTAGPGKELRIFGSGQPVIDRHEATWTNADRVQDRTLVRTTAASVGGWLVFAAGFAGALLLVALRVLDRQATIGDMVLTVTLAAQVNQQITGAVGMITWLMASLKTVGRYLWLVDYAAAARPKLKGGATVPDRLVDGIEFHDVSFRYPNTDVDILRDVDLRIPAGTTVAVVGDNGAGKTTLVKLLCRFYEPTEGRVTVDGVDLDRLDVDEWRRRLSGGFQDFARLELLAREGVGVGDLPLVDDGDAVASALGRAGADGLAESLPAGLETQVGRSFVDGVELSGGQWQKLALGRAMMRATPLLLVLDEPTAALDAETEHALFERYAGAARRVAGGTGAITVLVSHRFSTVRMADMIVVVDGGRVVEVGSHDDLVGVGGLYAELYELQARAYR